MEINMWEPHSNPGVMPGMPGMPSTMPSTMPGMPPMASMTGMAQMPGQE